MNKIFLIILMFGILSCSSDESEDKVICTLDLRAGIEVRVNDSDGKPLVTDVKITIIDREYTETLQNPSSSGAFYGAYERAGSYTIMVSKEGYQTYSSENPIVIQEDECHVILEKIEIELELN